jgi:hypothetical protein
LIFFVGKDSASANAIELARIAEPQPVLANSFAKLGIKEKPPERGASKFYVSTSKNK